MIIEKLLKSHNSRETWYFLKCKKHQDFVDDSLSNSDVIDSDYCKVTLHSKNSIRRKFELLFISSQNKPKK